MKVKFKGFQKTDGTRGPCKIKGVLHEPEKAYDVDDGLGDWMLGRDLAEKVEGEIPEVFVEGAPGLPIPPKPMTAYDKFVELRAPGLPIPPKPMTAYDKFVELIGAHTVQIYGDTGTGKSRLVHAIAMETQNILKKKVLYLDTEGSLSPEMEAELDNYEYIGSDLDALIERMRLVKKQRDQFDLLIADSIGFPVLTSYASLPLEKRLSAILSLTNVMADSVRFARASKHENLPAPEKLNLSIITNQPVSEFSRVAEDLPPEAPLEVFGGKISFIPKLTVRAEVMEYSKGKSVFKLVTHKARHLERGKEIALYTITDKGVEVKWLV